MEKPCWEAANGGKIEGRERTRKERRKKSSGIMRTMMRGKKREEGERRSGGDGLGTARI